MLIVIYVDRMAKTVRPAPFTMSVTRRQPCTVCREASETSDKVAAHVHVNTPFGEGTVLIEDSFGDQFVEVTQYFDTALTGLLFGLTTGSATRNL